MSATKLVMIILDTSAHRRSEPDFLFSIWGCAQEGAPKLKSIEIHEVWCLSLRLGAYCSDETFGDLTPMGPTGAPKGRPKWDPTRLSHKCLLFGINRFVLMPTVPLTLFWRTYPHGAPGASKGAPPDFHRNPPLYGIN